jgi:CheY-like chemotaxis protein
LATILLVDDEPLVRRSVGRLLARTHNVLQAGSGEDALELLVEQPEVDVILTDIMMPGIGGVGLYRCLPLALRTRVILMTGAFNSEPVEQLIESVALPVLLKPFFLQEIQDAIASVLERHPAAAVL